MRWIIAIGLMPYALLFDLFDTEAPDPYALRNHESYCSRLIRYAKRKP